MPFSKITCIIFHRCRNKGRLKKKIVLFKSRQLPFSTAAARRWKDSDPRNVALYDFPLFLSRFACKAYFLFVWYLFRVENPEKKTENINETHTRAYALTISTRLSIRTLRWFWSERQIYCEHNVTVDGIFCILIYSISI